MVRLPDGTMLQTVPKLVAGKIPGQHIICRIPDCGKNLCKNGWCEETMVGYHCHCSSGFQGRHCDEQSTEEATNKPTTSPSTTMTERSDTTTSQGTTTSESVESSTTDVATKTSTRPMTTVSDTTTSPETTASTCSSPPVDCEFGGSFYNFSTSKMNHASAVLACSQYGSHLVFIESQEEEDFIARHVEYYRYTWKTYYWIGLTGSSLSEARKAAKMIRRTRYAPKPSQNQAAAPEETAGADESVEEPSANPPQPPLTLADLNNSITEFQSFISSKLDGISTDVAAINKRFTDLEVSVNFNAAKIREIEDRKLPEVKDSTQKMMKVLENKIISLEIHNRKSNLLFYGINQNEGEDVYKVLKDAFATLGVDNAPTIAIANAHRLPRRGAADQTSQRGPVPIIARFCYMENRNAILAAFDNQQRNRAKATASPARAQPQSRLTVRTDLPPSLKIRRALLATEAYKMRKEQGLSTKIFVRGTEVCLQSKEKGTSKWIDYKD
eukprot:XP_011681334.1 PREDICTED: uncharacterized protein LOC105446343 [Strongylocentrotus purpuratus]